MTHENPKDELMIRVATAIYTVAVAAGSEGCKVQAFYPEAIVAIDAVRSYDAERRASVLDVAALVERYDPDDYRDLPVAMTGHVRFEGGLTEKKRD